jgi:hypothetical protein
MARIPAGAVDRFIAELPSILAEVRHIQKVAAQFNDMFDGALKMNLESAGSPTWTDDGLAIGTTTVRMPNGDVIKRERSIQSYRAAQGDGE